jgi:hypothetical protein
MFSVVRSFRSIGAGTSRATTSRLSRSSAIVNVFAFLDDQGLLFRRKSIPAFHIVNSGVTIFAITGNQERVANTVVPEGACPHRGRRR